MENSEDFMQKFLFEDIAIKGSFVRLEKSWREVVRRAKPDRSATELLAQTLCAAALLTSNIKFRGAVSLQIQAAGSIRFLLGQCTHDGQLRGVVRMYDSRLTTRGSSPVLAINLEPADGGSRYQGIVALEEQDLVEALQNYFYQSEQLATRFWLSASETHCTGLMIQRMPDHNFDPDDWNRICLMADTLSSHALLCLQPDRMINIVFAEDNVRLFSPAPLVFGCQCTKQRVTNVLLSLGEEEVSGIVEELNLVEVDCQYCGQSYQFDAIDVAQIFSTQSSPQTETGGPH